MKVSIYCVTYNHSAYIRSALEGFLSQKTDFRYEIYVYDDASTDGTSDIVREYAEKYPDIIIAHISQVNMFHSPNNSQFQAKLRHEKLKGEYIALCEGDDFWIDCHKLQIQVDYMEAHSECVLCMHNSLWIDYEKQSVYSGNPFDCISLVKDVSPEELIIQKHGHPPTASFVYRRSLEPLSDIFLTPTVFDYPLQLYALTKGTVHYIDRVMSVYRWCSINSFNYTAKTNVNRNICFCMEIICLLIHYDKYTNMMYHEIVSEKIQRFVIGMLYELDLNKSFAQYITEIKNSELPLCSFPAQYVDVLDTIKRQISDEMFCRNETWQYIKNHEEIWIMGTGRFANIITNQFYNNGIKFEGYTVTKPAIKEFKGKKVISLNELSNYKGDVGIIVAINPIHRMELEKGLRKVGMSDFYNPFLVELERV